MIAVYVRHAITGDKGKVKDICDHLPFHSGMAHEVNIDKSFEILGTTSNIELIKSLI